MKKISFITFCFLLLYNALKAQQNNIWYFGNGVGLNFNSGGPVALNDGVMLAYEGSSSVCDAAGNLLFYTNGVSIYSRNHEIMKNGDMLDGHLSSAQSSLIVPQPGSDSLFYVFTSDGFEAGFKNGYRYSIVDMSGDGGIGEVIVKNIPLIAPGTERLTAVRHANGLDVWVITNDNTSNIFRSWLLSCSGLSASPVISAAGDTLNLYPQMNSGTFKVSPDGKMLCQMIFAEVEEGRDNFFQLFDFDNSTGTISNPRKISVPGNRYQACEFSGDNKLLYVSKVRMPEIDQFELQPGTVSSIIASRVILPTSTPTIYGMQMGPDKKIYCNYGQYALSAINNPDVKGKGCNYVKDVVRFEDFKTNLGLPAFINDLYISNVNDFTYSTTDTCMGRVNFTGISSLTGSLEWQWDFGDGTYAYTQSATHTFPEPNKQYTVTMKVKQTAACGYSFVSKNIFPGGLGVNAAFKYIFNCDSGIASFVNLSTIIPPSPVNYQWSFGDGFFSDELNPSHHFPAAGNFTTGLRIHTGTACLDDSAVQIIPAQKAVIAAPPDAQIVQGQTVQLTTTGNCIFFSWEPATALNNTTIANPVAGPFEDITYTVTGTSGNGCTAKDDVLVKVITYDLFVPSAFTPNRDGKNDVLRPFINNSYTFISFDVFSRWGRPLFSTKENGRGWDGTVKGFAQDAGTYIWQITIKDKDGKLRKETGTVTLLR